MASFRGLSDLRRICWKADLFGSGKKSEEGDPGHDEDQEGGRSDGAGRGKPVVEGKVGGRGHPERGGEHLFLAGAGEGGVNESIGVDVLGYAGAADAEDGDTVFAGPNRGDASVEGVLLRAPIGDVHERDDDDLSAGLNETVHDAAVTEVVADGDGDFAPGRVPDFLRRRGQAVSEELDGDRFGLLEDDFSGWADDEGGVVEVAGDGIVFAAGDEVALVFAAPIADLGRDGAVEGVFGEDEELDVGILGDEAVEVFGDFE